MWIKLFKINLNRTRKKEDALLQKDVYFLASHLFENFAHSLLRKYNIQNLFFYFKIK